MANPFGTNSPPATPVAFVAPVTWKFWFTDGAHHLRHNSLRTDFQELWPGGDFWQMEWRATAHFEDRNADDVFRWMVQYLVVGIPDGYVEYRDAPIRRAYTGGPHVLDESIASEGLKRFSTATVILVGWRFGFWNDDHHMKQIGLRLTDVAFSQSAGRLSWKVHQTFSDTNGDDDYYWMYQYIVLGFNGTILRGSLEAHAEGPCGWGVDPEYTRANATLTAPSAAVLAGHHPVLIQGWWFELPPRAYNDDFHVRRNEFAVHGMWPTDNTLLYSAESRFGPIEFDCGRLHSPEATVPKMRLDVTALLYDHGFVEKYPPNSWYSGGQADWVHSGGRGERDFWFRMSPPSLW